MTESPHRLASRFPLVGGDTRPTQNLRLLWGAGGYLNTWTRSHRTYRGSRGGSRRTNTGVTGAGVHGLTRTVGGRAEVMSSFDMLWQSAHDPPNCGEGVGMQPERLSGRMQVPTRPTTVGTLES